MKTVFLSYRQTSAEERARVRAFGERLRSCGVGVILDQFLLDEKPAGPSEGWDKWSSDRALQTEYVIIIGSQSWFQCFEKSQPPDTGLGAACEADDLRTRIYDAAGIIDTIRVVLFDGADSQHISAKIKRYHRFHAEQDFENIVRWLGGTSAPPPVTPRAPKTSTPNNLPRLPFFFGREGELKRIASAIAADARGWGVIIDGPGGIGKSALAIRAAELVPEGRFQRIIFLSAKERELTADGQRALGTFVLPTCLEMLNAIARELERPELTKSTESERPELVLRALRDKSILLVLDNLETLPIPDRDQLFAFLNRLPQGTSAIVTSRRRADAGAVSVRLDRLEWEAAQQLMQEMAKDSTHLAQVSDADRRALYDETGGNPLLMRWVAGQLRAGRRAIESALELLRSPEAGNNPLEFVFGDLLDTFSVNETKVLAALTHFTLPIETKFIAELSGINEQAAQGALSDLSGRALVMPDTEERTFTLVPMVADFLRAKKPEAVAETGDRLEKRAYALIIENGYRKYDRFPILEAAWPSIAPALTLFLAGDNQRLQTVCDALQHFLSFQGRWDEQLILSEKAEARALAASDFGNAGWQAFIAGYTHSLRQQGDAVLSCAERAAALWASAGPRERACVIRLRGIGYKLKRDYPAAIATFRQALHLYSSIAAESVDVAIALNSIGSSEQLSGNLVAAEEHFRESLRIARAAGYNEGVAYVTGNLANLALNREDWLTGGTLACEALRLSEAIHRQDLIAFNCRVLAESLVRQGQAAEALPHRGARWRSLPASALPTSPEPRPHSPSAKVWHPARLRQRSRFTPSASGTV